jgi:FixJ family two-component response regulator
MPSIVLEATESRRAFLPNGFTVVSDVEPIIYVVDDDISVRESLEMLLISEGFKPQLFESAVDFMAHPRPRSPACLVLDVNMPDLNGLDLQAHITGDQADLPIIFITGFGDIPTSVRAMKAGAAEFLTKPIGDAILVAAIRQAIERSRVSLDERANLRVLQDAYEALSRREREVMALVVSGLMNKQVGGELGISEITVKAHRGRMMRKMNARSLAALMEIARRLGVRKPSGDEANAGAPRPVN